MSIRKQAITIGCAALLCAVLSLAAVGPAQAYYVEMELTPLQQIFLDTIYGDAWIYFWFGS